MAPRPLQIEGRLQVIEITGAWGVYAGERIVIGFELPSVRLTIELLELGAEG